MKGIVPRDVYFLEIIKINTVHYDGAMKIFIIFGCVFVKKFNNVSALLL